MCETASFPCVAATDSIRNGLTRFAALLPLLALAFLMAVPAPAYATDPDYYPVNLSISAILPSGTTEHTPLEPKMNDMPSYVLATSYSSGVIVGIAGIDGYTLAVTNRTINTYAYFRGAYINSSIRNLVYENGEYHAWLWLYKSSSAPTLSDTYVNGIWLPDGAAVYTVINNGY